MSYKNPEKWEFPTMRKISKGEYPACRRWIYAKKKDSNLYATFRVSASKTEVNTYEKWFCGCFLGSLASGDICAGMVEMKTSEIDEWVYLPDEHLVKCEICDEKYPACLNHGYGYKEPEHKLCKEMEKLEKGLAWCKNWINENKDDLVPDRYTTPVSIFILVGVIGGYYHFYHFFRVLIEWLRG